MLHLEIIAFNEPKELLDLIGLGLPIDILQIDSFWDVGMDINVMTAMDTGELKPKGFGACDGFGKTDIFGAGQQLLEEPTPSTLCHRYASVVLRGILSLLLLPMASFLVQPNASLQLLPEAGARHERRLEAVSCKALLGARLGTDFRLASPSPAAFGKEARLFDSDPSFSFSSAAGQV